MHLAVVGGSDAGISAALRARELDPTVDDPAGSDAERLVFSRYETRAALAAGPAAAVLRGAVFAQLGSWGLRHRPTSRALRVRAELLDKAAPRSGRSSWTSFAASTLLQVPSAITERSRALERGPTSLLSTPRSC